METQTEFLERRVSRGQTGWP